MGYKGMAASKEEWNGSRVESLEVDRQEGSNQRRRVRKTEWGTLVGFPKPL